MRRPGWLTRKHREDDLAAELNSHLELATHDLKTRGDNDAVAANHARRELGNVTLVKETVRANWSGAWINRFGQDLRHALRMMRRNPGFSLVAILTIGLGIGVNAAVFSLIDAALFSPEPYPDPTRLLVLKQIVLSDPLNTSAAEFLDYRTRNRAFESLAGFESVNYDLTGMAQPERINGVRVTANLFRTLGMRPIVGHTFIPEQDFAGGQPEAVLSYGFWRSHYAGNIRAVIGKSLRLNEKSYTIIGVMPDAFEFPASPGTLTAVPALWTPMAFSRDEIADRAASYDISAIGRLKPGVSPADAQRDVSRIAEEFEREHPEVYAGNVHTKAAVEVLGAATIARRKPVMMLLAAGVLLVLLIACVNLANLLLARAIARRQEIAARVALGANGRVLMLHLFTESTLLTCCGGALGFVLAWALSHVAIKLDPADALPEVHISTAVLLLCALLAGATGIICGLAPAWQCAKTNAADALKQGGRGSTAVYSAKMLGRSLVMLEVALSFILLIGAALLIRSFAALLATPPGFDPTGVTIVRSSFNRARYPDAGRRHLAEELILARLRAIPGVASAALTSHLPIADSRSIGFTVEGRDPNVFYWADNALVDGNYFQSMRIPLVSGRTFDTHDTPTAPLAAVINQTMARQFWRNENAVGKWIRWGGRPLVVVGIVGDVHLQALEMRAKPTVYSSVLQVESGATTSAVFILRGVAGQRADLAASAREIIRSIDPGLPVFETTSMEQILRQSLASRRFTASILAAFAALALVLSAIGLYGVLSYAVEQRTRELGVRLALGAAPHQLLWITTMEGLRLGLTGVLAGSLGGAALAFGMSRLLFNVRPLDPLSFAIAAIVLLTTSAMAAFVPALRAARIDPLDALRCE